MTIYFNSRSPFPTCRLSNFWPSSIAWDGRIWRTAEHLYQARKSIRKEDQEAIRSLRSAVAARRAGQRLHLRTDWEDVKTTEMLDVITLKFDQSDRLMEYLKSTDPEPLIHEAPWDAFWGWPGQNKLGEILMEVRARAL